MQRARLTVHLYHDTRRILSSGLFPVKVCVTFKDRDGKWKQKYFPTGISLSKGDMEKVNSGKVRGDLIDIRNQLLEQERMAGDRFTGKTSSIMVVPLFAEIIAAKESEGQVGSAESFQCALNALTEYGGAGLRMDQIDVTWLKGYESWARKPRAVEKRLNPVTQSSTTIGIYLRNLRTVFNIAIERKIISAEIYPFGRKRYVIPTSRNIKKALTLQDKDTLIGYKPESDAQKRALDAWIFSYYCNGMNFSDIAHLTKENIRGDVLHFKRNKTLRTKNEEMPIVMILRKEALAILRTKVGHPYLFGVIDKSDSPQRRKEKIKQWIKNTNERLETICKHLGIERVTTYTARHTAATMMLRGGSKVLDIRDALGHSSITTTEKYLASLDLEQRRKMSEGL